MRRKKLQTDTLIKRFKSFYSNLVPASQGDQESVKNEWAELDEIYAPEIYFCDPIHCVEGRESLHHYIADICENLTECRFVYLDEVILDGTAYIKWDMYFTQPKFGEQSIQVRGVSQIEFDESGIYFHEDFYDLGAMLYENIPVLGGGVRWLKKRLAQASA